MGRDRLIAAMEGLRSFVLTPIKNMQAERLRCQQAEALLGKDRLTTAEIRQLSGLAIVSSNSCLSALVGYKLLDVVKGRKYSPDEPPNSI